MDGDLQRLLAELEAFGVAHDRTAGERARKMLNITRDTGEFLVTLVAAARARRVLEIGTSNGYSTLWLAHGARLVGGAVTTVERSRDKADLASANFARSALSPLITQARGDAEHVLGGAASDSFDVIFLDAERTDYPGWWNDLRRVLRAGGVLVVDNAISHASEVEPFLTIVRRDPGFVTSLVPVGKGEFLAVKLDG
jgi:predicted O-methyltransferase YrrM